MGTNFYWHEDCPEPCEHCAQEPVHVGKRSGGWSFGFRAYKHAPFDVEHPEWGYEFRSPFGASIESRADWREVFTARAGRLVDEYGLEEADPVAWLDALTPPDVEQQRREWSREWMGSCWERDPKREWRDAEGFRFYLGEFS